MHKTQIRIPRIAGLLLVLAVCTGLIVLAVQRVRQEAPAADGKLTVTATYYPLYEFARQVGGDAAQVTNATPVGTEPHDYEPSPQALVQMGESRLFIYNGSSFERWTGAFLREYRGVAVKASEGIPLLEAKDGDHDDDHHRDAAVSDPHFWLDPMHAQTIVGAIRDAYVRADPARADRYRANADRYIRELQRLNADFAAGLRDCQMHTIITSHAAFGYVAQRYGLEVVPIAGISPEDEPSAAKLAEISTLVRNRAVTTIFFERLVSPRLADTIAREAGAQTAALDPVEGIDDAAQKAGKTYLTTQRDNLGALRAALTCR